MLSAVIVAAGNSRRMGFDKLAASLEGRPVLWHSVRAFASFGAVQEVVVVAHPERVCETESLAKDAARGICVRIVSGGAERHLSVWEGLKTLNAGGDGDGQFVAIHDGARPLVTQEALGGCLALAIQEGAACCASPIPDTVKKVDAAQVVQGSVDRDGLWAMQTPQIFSLPLIRKAYRALMDRGESVTDEVSAVQAIGGRVALYRNEEWNFKITFPRDIEMASQVLRWRGFGEESEG